MLKSRECLELADVFGLGVLFTEQTLSDHPMTHFLRIVLSVPVVLRLSLRATLVVTAAQWESFMVDPTKSLN